MKPVSVQKLIFIDDIKWIVESDKTLQHNLRIHNKELQEINMERNTNKISITIMAVEVKETQYHSGSIGTIIEENCKIQKELNEWMGQTDKIY